jgi:ferritin
MISETMQQLFTHLIQVEHHSAYLYLAMSAYFDRIGLLGTKRWLEAQAEEERGHAQRLIGFLVDRDGVVKLHSLPEQPASFGTPLEAFQKVLAHEQFVTEQYHEAHQLVTAENDRPSLPIILAFLEEQVEEEGQALTIVDRFKIAGSNAAAILLIDQELGRRGG